MHWVVVPREKESLTQCHRFDVLDNLSICKRVEHLANDGKEMLQSGSTVFPRAERNRGVELGVRKDEKDETTSNGVEDIAPLERDEGSLIVEKVRKPSRLRLNVPFNKVHKNNRLKRHHRPIEMREASVLPRVVQFTWADKDDQSNERQGHQNQIGGYTYHRQN